MLLLLSCYDYSDITYNNMLILLSRYDYYDYYLPKYATISQQTPYAEEHYWLVNTHYLYGECLDAEIAYRISVQFLV